MTTASSGQSSYIPAGSAAARIRDNTSTSIIEQRANLDVRTYSELRVSFKFIMRSMDNANEDFWLQYTSNGGNSWQTVQGWAPGGQFSNGVFYSVTVPITQAVYAFTNQAGIRFRCDASGNGDYVYIDDVRFEGLLP